MLRYLGFFAIGMFLAAGCTSSEPPGSAESGDPATELYDTARNAMADIDTAIHLAGTNNKHVLIQVGGNWCKWCIRLHYFIQSHPQLDSIITSDYVLIRVNYSKENKPAEAMKRLGFPDRFGFPVMVILDNRGNVLHIQDTYYLEQEDGYSEEKIKRFLLNWNRKAVHPDLP